MNYSAQFDSVVSNIISSFGGTGTLRIFTEGVYSDGELIATTFQDYSVNIATFDYPATGSGAKSNFGTLILEGDLQCFVQPINKVDTDAEQPKIKSNRDLIIINGVEWKILTLKEMNPSGVNAILFDMHLRK